MSVFDYVNSISFGKHTDLIGRDEFDKEYVPFIVNRAFSYHRDSVLAANLMNERPGTPVRLQYLFLLHTLRARKRFAKWIKSTVSEDAQVVAEYYGCSLRKARDLVSLHTAEQLIEIRRRLDKGGATKRGATNAGS